MATPKYTASVTSTGGGRDGHVTGDAHIDLDVRPPTELGGDGAGVNPEALLGSSWAACYNGALQKMMREAGVEVSAHQPEITAHITFNAVDEGFRLSGKLEVSFADQENVADAEGLIEKAHAFCPVSKALRGDMDLEVGLK